MTAPETGCLGICQPCVYWSLGTHRPLRDGGTGYDGLSGSGADNDFLVRLARPALADADGHLAVEAFEEVERLLGGEPAEMPIHQVRDFRLLDAEQRRD